MTILNKLASAQGRRDEEPNQALAREIVRSKDRAAVKELVENLFNKKAAIQSDCIKVLYEIGAQKPELIAKYHAEIGKLLDCKNNRLAWGAMTALDAIASDDPKAIAAMLPRIVQCAKNGSVITRDHAVDILIKLAGRKPYAKKCLPLLLQQLQNCPANQFPMYVEMTLPLATGSFADDLQAVIHERISKLPKDSQRKRVTRALKQITD
jgi:hypothetical protein